MRHSSIWPTATVALGVLLGSATAILAQASDQDHDVHHPLEGPTSEAQPAPPAGAGSEQPGAAGAGPQAQGTGTMGSGMGMNPDMMRMMQQMMGGQQGGMGQGMMGQRGPASGMSGRGMMGGMGYAGNLRILFAIVDGDGDGALSLEEIQAAHARIFNHADADDDGRLTLNELQAFRHGMPAPALQMPTR